MIRELPLRHRALPVDDDGVGLILHGRGAEAEAEPDVGRAGHGNVDGFGVVRERQLKLAQLGAPSQSCDVGCGASP